MPCPAPGKDCALCPRLADFRGRNRLKFPDKFNAPVPSFGPEDAEFLVVGLAPGLKGANFSGRPFTGDYAGELLYSTLLKYGFAEGVYGARADDGLTLKNCRITNAVRCVPPENKPTPDENNAMPGFFKGGNRGDAGAEGCFIAGADIAQRGFEGAGVQGFGA